MEDDKRGTVPKVRPPKLYTSGKPHGAQTCPAISPYGAIG